MRLKITEAEEKKSISIVLSEDLLSKIEKVKDSALFQLDRGSLLEFCARTPNTIYDIDTTVKKLNRKQLKTFIRALRERDYVKMGLYIVKKQELTIEDIIKEYSGRKTKTTEKGAELINVD